MQLIPSVCILLLTASSLKAAREPGQEPGGQAGQTRRVAQFKTIQTEYSQAHKDLDDAIQAGKVKATPDGGYKELGDLRNRFAKRTRALIDANRAFALVGINGDGDLDKSTREKLKQQITSRSFKDYSIKDMAQISQIWDVHECPTIFLIDHKGVIRNRYRGMPEAKVVDGAIENLVVAAEGEPDKK